MTVQTLRPGEPLAVEDPVTIEVLTGRLGTDFNTELATGEVETFREPVTITALSADAMIELRSPDPIAPDEEEQHQ